MTIFHDTFASNPASDLNSLFGETITYTPAGGVGVSRTARIMRDSVDSAYVTDGNKKKQMCRVIILRNATTGVASPAIGDSVTFDSVDWNVESIASQDGAVSELIVIRWVDIEKSRQTHRIGL